MGSYSASTPSMFPASARSSHSRPSPWACAPFATVVGDRRLLGLRRVLGEHVLVDAPPVRGATQHEQLAEVGLGASAVGHGNHRDGLLGSDDRDLVVDLG